MTREEAIAVIKEAPLYNDTTWDFANKLHEAIKILEQEPCEDAISRQAVLDLVEHYNSDGLGSVFNGYEQGIKFTDAINKLSPVTPQYTDAEIQKMQEIEQAEIQKAYELGKEDKIKVLDKVRGEIDKIYEREGNSYDCLNALDDLKWFIDKYKESEVEE